MNQQEIFNDLVDILQEVGDVNPAVVALDSSLSSDLDVDSLLMVEILVAAEEKFGAEIPDENVRDLKTVGDLVRHISQQFVPA